MPNYVIQIDEGDSTSGIIVGNAVNSQIPTGALISPPNYEQLIVIDNIHPLLLTIDAGDIREMTDTEKTNAPSGSVDVYRKYRMDLVDTKTQEALDVGFEYPAGAGKVFDMNDTARSRWIGLKQAFDASLISSQEVRYRDRSKYLIADSADMTGFYVTALGFEVGATSVGGSILDDLEDETTLKGLNDVIDPR